jgi:hypothetical protein
VKNGHKGHVPVVSGLYLDQQAVSGRKWKFALRFLGLDQRLFIDFEAVLYPFRVILFIPHRDQGDRAD